MQKLRSAFSFFALALLVSSPNGASQTPPSPGSAASIAEGTGILGEKSSGTIIVKLSSYPNPPIRGSGTLVAIVTDARGEAIDDAELSFDLDMIKMSHGKNLVVAVPQGRGQYLGKVRYMMPGVWRVIVRIARAGHSSEALRFEFKVNSR